MITSYAVPAFIWAYIRNVIHERSASELPSRDNITRAEAAQMFVNYKNNVK